MMRINPVISPEARSLELATKIALYIDSLSTSQSGDVLLDFSQYKYDISVEKDGSEYYATAVPYIEQKEGGKTAEKKGEKQKYRISAFGSIDDCLRVNLDSGCKRLFSAVSKICIVKETGKEFPEVKKCS